MEKHKEPRGYNFNSVDLLIYIWKKRFILAGVGLIAGIASIVISLLITPMFQSTVIMFPASNASISKDLLSQNYSGRQSVHGFGEEEQAELDDALCDVVSECRGIARCVVGICVE